MTIGIAAFGPGSGQGVLEGLRAVERIGRGAIGGFVSFVALTGDGRALRGATQTGGSDAVFPGGLPAEAAAAPLAALISSGPDRPEPLSDFLAAEPGVGLVTGHRMPQTRTPEGVPLNQMVLAQMRAGLDPQQAVDHVILRYPRMDAGFVALGVSGRIGLGSTAQVLARGDQGSGRLGSPDGEAGVASLHNAIHPHRLIAAVANEMTLDRMLRVDAPLCWIRFRSGVPFLPGPAPEVHTDPSGTLECIRHPDEHLMTGRWSVGLGDRVAVVQEGRHIGWLGYEPFLVCHDGIVASVDGKHAIETPVTRSPP